MKLNYERVKRIRNMKPYQIDKLLQMCERQRGAADDKAGTLAGNKV